MKYVCNFDNPLLLWRTNQNNNKNQNVLSAMYGPLKYKIHFDINQLGASN